MIEELRASTRAAIYSFPLPDDQGEWTVIMQKWVNFPLTDVFDNYLLIIDILEWWVHTWFIMATVQQLKSLLR